MALLGIWDGHDSGAVLVHDGRIAAAFNEERLTRRKLEARFPSASIGACLTTAGLTAADVDVVAASTSDPAKTLARWWPPLKERYYRTRRRQSPPGLLSTATRNAKYWITEWPPNALSRRLSRVALERALRGCGLGHARLEIYDHHACHAAAAARCSTFASCAVVTIDGVGDGLSSTISRFDGNTLTRVASSRASESLGVFFEHVTYLLNMRELEDEGKVMALADYAAPVPDSQNPMLGLVRVEHGSVRTTLPGHALLHRLSAIHWRYPNEQFASMAQRTVDVTCTRLVQDAIALTGCRRIALAGGVVSNVKANRSIRLMPDVDAVYVFPHMGDGGLALGAAAMASADRSTFNVDDVGLGSSFSGAQVGASLARAGLESSVPSELSDQVAALIAGGAIVLWYQGRMEYGPRALGHRSVLARPDRTAIRDRLNLVLKQRVWYQPFCPTMLESEAAEVLADYAGPPNPHMTMAYLVAEGCRDAMAGVTSVDGTCRPQIVADSADGPFPAVLRAVKARLGRGIVLNTSYNIHGEPLVCTPDEAIDVFRRTGADALAIEGHLVRNSAGRGA